MDYVRFGTSDLTVSRLGLGCMSMSSVYGKAEDERGGAGHRRITRYRSCVVTMPPVSTWPYCSRTGTPSANIQRMRMVQMQVIVTSPQYYDASPINSVTVPPNQHQPGSQSLVLNQLTPLSKKNFTTFTRSLKT